MGNKIIKPSQLEDGLTLEQTEAQVDLWKQVRELSKFMETNGLDVCTTRMEWTNSKYLFERKPFKRWFVFGYDNKGLVDISDGDDILTKVPKETAFKLIELRNQFINQVENLIYKPEDKDHE